MSNMICGGRVKFGTMKLGDRIKRAIDSAGLTQSDIARSLNISRAAVSYWCNGTVKDLRMEYLFALARLTGFNAEWLALERGPMRPKPPLRGLTAAEERLLHLWRDMTPETQRQSLGLMILNRTMQSPAQAVADDSGPYETAGRILSELDDLKK